MPSEEDRQAQEDADAEQAARIERSEKERAAKQGQVRPSKRRD